MVADDYAKNLGQGKSTPGTAAENLFLEGKGFFLVRTPEGNSVYTRLGEFTFDGEGVYKDKDGLVIIKFNEVEDWEAIGFPKGSISHGVEIKKGEAIGQAVFQKYLVADNDNAEGDRTGGFGSTDKK